MKLRNLTILFLFFTTVLLGQTTSTNENSILGQFDKIYRTSTSYQTYKVISKDKFLELKQLVTDSVSAYKETIKTKERLLNLEKENIIKTNQDLSKTKLELETALQNQDTISLFGLSLGKKTYNFSLWGIILLLILTLVYFIYRFTGNISATKEAKEILLELELEFEQHRKKSLEREQKVRRQLQDEINKQKNIKS